MGGNPLMTGDNVRLVRDLTGHGIMDAKRVIELAGTEEFGGDVVLAVAYVNASQYAIMVHGDRHAWNMAKALERVDGLRERCPELDAAFPRTGAAPSP